jgi:protein tyrosine phosphatase
MCKGGCERAGTFQVFFFILHPTNVSEPPDKNLD